ncbi:MAG: PAS domain S-box protein [Bacteroidales bacterium]|nr:PAS domain S-box protein [Bacteroidales bacterium]
MSPKDNFSRKLITDILTILNRPNEWQRLIHDIVSLIKEVTGFEAIGIRLRDGEDFPYFEKTGFPEIFTEDRNSLCQRNVSGEVVRDTNGIPLLECMCGKVISGAIATAKPQFTANGSFWTNRVSGLITQPGNSLEVLFPRGRCVQDGYESIALIPLKSGDTVIGLLQLNDHRVDLFTPDLIGFFEELGNTIGVAFYRVLQERNIRASEKQFRMLFEHAPFPRWIYDLETLAFLEVNEAAVTHYGFSREEFLTMTLKDIRPTEEIPTLLDNISRNKEEFQSSSNWHHRKKDGSLIEVEITSHATTYNGRNARVVLAKDVTEQRRQERELRDTKTYLEKLLDNANAPIITLNSDLSVRGVNREFRDMTGFTTEEFYTLGFQILFTEDQLEGIRGLTEEVKQGVQWKNLEIPVRTKSGGIREVNWNTANIFADDGTTLISVLAIGNDITERKKAEWDLRQSEQLLGEVVEILPVGIWITDASGQINIGNPAGRQIWAGARYVGPEQYGEYKGWWRSSGKKIEPHEWAAARAVSNGETSIDEEIEIECFDGTRKIILNSAIPIKNEEGDITGAVIVNQDITERIESENQIRRINRVLEEAKVKAEESDRLKTSLLNNLSHEFRTPMNAILGFSSMIETDSAEPEFRGMAHRINIAGDRLMKTLDDILELAQLESIVLDDVIEPVNVIRWIEEMMPEFRAKAVAKGLEISFVPSCMAEARINPNHLVKAIYHLVDNAIKFTDQGGVGIQVEQISERRHKWIGIRIKDTGVGIPKEHQQVIFEAFRQASEGYGRTYEGTGLGLTIANKIASTYNGKITLNSCPGEGSTFIMALPRESTFPSVGEEFETETQDELPAVKTIEDLASPPGEIHILVVEDNPDNVELLTAYLQEKYQISVALDGKNALALADQIQFDLILMDINLGPDMNGLDVTRIIRKKPGYDHIPVIAVTGYTNASDKNEIFQAGCSHYLGKPFTKEQLLEKIKEALT